MTHTPLAHAKKSKKGISVIVLTWNGRALIAECLPPVLREIRTWTIPHEVIVVDNGSSDDTVPYIREHFPEVTLMAFGDNLGFARANNRAVQCAQFDTLLFLNNDIVLGEHFIGPLVERLEKDDVFAVAPQLFRWDRVTIDDGLRYGMYFSGLFDVHLETNPMKSSLPHYVTFFCGACVLCKKDLFVKWGGFDELYTPYAWEDLDLGYRAWKRGYKILYEPRSRAYHKREATTRSLFSNFFFITLMWRNKFIFMWKNLTYPAYWRQHLRLLPWKLLKFLCNGRWRYVIGFFRALRYLPHIMRARSEERARSRYSDKDVLERSYRPLEEETGK